MFSLKIGLVNNIKKLNYHDFLIFMVPFVIFSLYLYIFNPGVMSFDSLDQLHQIATTNFRNWHPFFHTFIEMLCIKIYANPISICLLQIFTFSIFWMIICKYNRNDQTFNKQFLLQLVFTIIISLIPMNAMYSITLWKDILFSYFLMFLCFLVKMVLDKQGELNFEFILILSLVMAFVCQLRANGFFIIILLMLVFVIYFLKLKKPKTCTLIVVFTLIFVMLIASLNVMYDVEDNQKDAVFIKTTHMLSFYNLEGLMEDNDNEKIYNIVSQQDIEENFNMYYSDPLLYVSNETAYDVHKIEFFDLIFKYSLYNPEKFFEYIFESSAIVWDITRDDDWVGSIYYTTPELSDYYSKYNIVPVANYENMSSENFGTMMYNIFDSFINFFKDNTFLNILFNSPALYMYLSILIMIVIQFLTKSKNIYMVFLPNLFNILSILLSTPIQDNRYLYANFLVFYLLVIILLGVVEHFSFNCFSNKKIS